MAFISDLHGNREAADAVFNDIAERGINQVYHLGDLIGYGPDSVYVANAVFDRGIPGVPGNHEVGILKDTYDTWNDLAANAGRYTRNLLLKDDNIAVTNQLWELVRGPRYRLFEVPMDGDKEPATGLIVHGAPHKGEEVDDYLKSYHLDGRPYGWGWSDELRKAEEICGKEVHALLHGHTHRPLIRTSDLNGSGDFEDPYLYVVNVGSVGQPRDENPRACYTIIHDDGCVEHIRVDYDFRTTMKKIEQLGKTGELMSETAELLSGRLEFGQ